jgi:hypothetical protein
MGKLKGLEECCRGFDWRWLRLALSHLIGWFGPER